MRVLSVASEAYPLVKTGGLADVAGALPGALLRHDCAVTTFLPGYRQVMAKISGETVIHNFGALFGASARLLSVRHDGLDLVILDCPSLFNREGGPYGDATGRDWPDNWTRFAAFGAAAAALGTGRAGGQPYDIVHAHDWQAGLTAAYIRNGRGLRPPVVMTIHNMAFQGQFSPAIFPALGLPADAMTVDGLEYYGDVGFLKAGLQYADAITTVSPTYAEEITTPEFGMGLDGLIRARRDVLHGIVNGIDTSVWNPGTDGLLPSPYTSATLDRRQANRTALAARFGIEATDGPLFGLVSRLTWQKGIDLVADAADDIVAMGGSLVVLGSGDGAIEASLQAAAARHPGRIGIIIGYDEVLSHLMQGGADVVLVPSRFEPCGLTQLCALRYGAIPLVGRTGGLADTVIDLTHATMTAKVATGFQFFPVTREPFGRALRRAAELYANKPQWLAMQKRAMASDVSWDHSAALYAALYRDIAHRNAQRMTG
ncbi:MAG: glycogen synthase GlgA [Phyllobacteriaceae bacterium]|nr:glycogen synthase GlgA [Phyllobacteriaceae bacterium]